MKIRMKKLCKVRVSDRMQLEVVRFNGRFLSQKNCSLKKKFKLLFCNILSLCFGTVQGVGVVFGLLTASIIFPMVSEIHSSQISTLSMNIISLYNKYLWLYLINEENDVFVINNNKECINILPFASSSSRFKTCYECYSLRQLLTPTPARGLCENLRP